MTGAAIVRMSDVNRQETVCATDDVADRLETLKFTLGEGRCVHAVSTGRKVLLSDLREERQTRWPMFVRQRSTARRHRSSRPHPAATFPGRGPVMISGCRPLHHRVSGQDLSTFLAWWGRASTGDGAVDDASGDVAEPRSVSAGVGPVPG